jgi:hypothetical protein
MIQKIFFTTLALFLFSACGTSKRVVVAEQKELPSWYVQVPKNTTTDLYAVGSGQNKKDAITDALTQMISTLGVCVSSKFTSKTVVREGGVESYNATYTNDSTSEVKQIRISNYELLQAQSLGYKKYAVLVKSNKQKLFQSMKQEIDQKFYKIAQKEKILQKQNMLKQLQFYKKAMQDLSLLENELIIMHELRPSFNTEEYLSKYNALDVNYETLYKSISFSFECNTQAKNLEAPLAKGISAKKFKLSSKKGKGHFVVVVRSQIEKANSYGFTLARSSISIEVKDYKGEIIGSNEMNLVGQSTQGYKIAKQNVAIKLEALIQKEGIAKVLGVAI